MKWYWKGYAWIKQASDQDPPIIMFADPNEFQEHYEHHLKTYFKNRKKKPTFEEFMNVWLRGFGKPLAPDLRFGRIYEIMRKEIDGE